MQLSCSSSQHSVRFSQMASASAVNTFVMFAGQTTTGSPVLDSPALPPLLVPAVPPLSLVVPPPSLVVPPPSPSSPPQLAVGASTLTATSPAQICRLIGFLLVASQARSCQDLLPGRRAPIGRSAERRVGYVISWFSLLFLHLL